MPDHLSSPIKNGGRKWTGDETRGRRRVRVLEVYGPVRLKLICTDLIHTLYYTEIPTAYTLCCVVQNPEIYGKFLNDLSSTVWDKKYTILPVKHRSSGSITTLFGVRQSYRASKAKDKAL